MRDNNVALIVILAIKKLRQMTEKQCFAISLTMFNCSLSKREREKKNTPETCVRTAEEKKICLAESHLSKPDFLMIELVYMYIYASSHTH